MKFYFENFYKTFTISNEYVTSRNKQKEASNHGQSKLKFKSSSLFFRNSIKKEFRNKLGRKSKTSDNFSYEGVICFMKKHIIHFFNDLKPIYNNNVASYKNISINDWNKFFNEFSNKYQKYNDNDIITEIFTTTSYRHHEQGLEFEFYKNFIFKVAIPYASKIIFYKIKNENKLFFIPKVDFSLLKTSYFEKLKIKRKKIYNRNIWYQQKWREKIILMYRHCLITNLKCTDVLEAAHIKPFCKCDEQEQFNVNNGVLLTSTFHRFFDQGLISFCWKTGKLLLSEFLIEYDKQWIKKESHDFKTLKSLCLNWSKTSHFLKFHNENIFIDN